MSKTIHWASDSTVKTNDITTYPQTGIGQVMQLFIENDVHIKNYAENGRSTKSFIDESRLAAIYSELNSGEFLFIQFGHNDAKAEDLSRFTQAYGDYQVNLEKFINVARNRKAHPVLITPLCRRWFKEDGGLEANIHGDYPKAMIELAGRLDVPCIDLYSLSRGLIESIGLEESRKYFMHLNKGQYDQYPQGLEDNTHLKYEGAVAFAALIVEGLKALGDDYASLVK